MEDNRARCMSSAQKARLTDWRQIRDAQGSVFYFSPSTGATSHNAPRTFVPATSESAVTRLQAQGDWNDDAKVCTTALVCCSVAHDAQHRSVACLAWQRV